MSEIQDDILSYREMCDAENVQTLQRGMNFRMNVGYSVILMSRRPNAPYRDRVFPDGVTIEYEGHDVSRLSHDHDPKHEDQPRRTPSGRLTQNGLFASAVDEFRQRGGPPHQVKVYEKLFSGVWSLKGLFDLVDYEVVNDGARNVFRFVLRLSAQQAPRVDSAGLTPEHTRLIPSEVKQEVWKRDRGKCVLCGATTNLHFDHDLPFSKGGTSLTTENVRLLCMRHNLMKSDKIQ